MKTLKKYFYKIAFLIFDLYYWVKNYVLRGEFEKKHIVFQKEGSQFKLVIKSHEDFVEEIQERIDDFKQKGDEEEYIKYALEQALEGCVYIIISKGERFVQFWTGRGRLDFDFQVKNNKTFKPYYYQIIGMLADIDFVRDSFVPSPFPTITGIKPSHTYKIEESGDIKTITGYFNKLIPEASVFTLKVFEEIFKEKKGKLEIKVG